MIGKKPTGKISGHPANKKTVSDAQGAMLAAMALEFFHPYYKGDFVVNFNVSADAPDWFKRALDDICGGKPEGYLFYPVYPYRLLWLGLRGIAEGYDVASDVFSWYPSEYENWLCSGERGRHGHYTGDNYFYLQDAYKHIVADEGGRPPHIEKIIASAILSKIDDITTEFMMVIKEAKS